MITTFLESWDLFYLTYLTGWAIAAGLGLAGIIVVARDQIFLGAAVSQAAAFGVAAALLLKVSLGSDQYDIGFFDPVMLVIVLGCAAGAALLTSYGSGASGEESYESVTGWVFLGATSVSVLMAQHLIHGTEEIQKMLMSTLIGSTYTELLLFLALDLIIVLLFVLLYRPLLLFLLDEPTFAAVGGRTALWRPLVAIGLGLLIGLAIRSSGMLFTFGCLVLPAMIAKNILNRVLYLFFFAPLLAVVFAGAGFMSANHYDFPPGQMVVALLAAGFAVSWVGRRIMEAR